MSELRNAVEQCVERLQRHRQRGQRIGEQNTKASLVEPVIGALGWDIFDTDEVHREYRRRGHENPVDYALLMLRTPRLFIEAKGLGENLDDPRWANQTIGYATMAGVEWVSLTDGSEWRIYNAHAPVPIEQKLFRSVKIDEDVDGAVETLSLLSKENMRENRIEELWKGFFIDRQVHAELTELFTGSDPAPELVELLDRRMSRLSRDEIRASLIRARVSFDFPLATLSGGVRQVTSHGSGGEAVQPLASPIVPAQPVRLRQLDAISAAGGSRNKRRVTPEERKLRVGDLLASGRLRPGAMLSARYLGAQHTAEVLAAGEIRYGGRVYQSPSGAGEAVKKSVHGDGISESQKATDGLDFWHAEDALVGDRVSLKEMRRRVANQE